MPFPVPSEPVFAARSEAIERAGGSGFSNLSVPAMTLTLVQGFGRLIRSKTDKGIVAILDSRLSSKGYGRKIVKALPDSPVISTLAEAEAFFAA
jgi:ATP-dependent DNA helicase DinG